MHAKKLDPSLRDQFACIMIRSEEIVISFPRRLELYQAQGVTFLKFTRLRSGLNPSSDVLPAGEHFRESLRRLRLHGFALISSLKSAGSPPSSLRDYFMSQVRRARQIDSDRKIKANSTRFVLETSRTIRVELRLHIAICYVLFTVFAILRCVVFLILSRHI